METTILLRQKIEVKDIAAALADQSDNEQAEFFNRFFDSLFKSCDNREHFFDNQILHISVKLDQRAKDSMRIMTEEFE